MGTYGTGQPIRRKEDERFTQGHGQYTDDIAAADALRLFLFRSPYAHGAINVLDVTDAREVPGVQAIYTAADLTAAGIRDLPASGFPASSQSPARSGLGQPPLARGKVRYVGEPVAGIVADSLAAARDAAELIEFDVEELDAVVSPRAAFRPGAPLVHDEVDANRFAILEHGDKAKTEAAFATANTVASVDIRNNRLAPTALEPRGCVVDYDKRSDKMTLQQGCQGVHSLKGYLLDTLDVDDLHVISPDVGGGFGLKMFLQCETVVAAHAARDLGRKVKWIAERSESFLADVHGRDHQTRASLALDGEGKILAMRVEIDAATGAYCGQVGAAIPWFGATMSAGCYQVPTGYVAVNMAATNTCPVDAYRGAGRPEAAYVIERLMDEAARETGIARDEIRRRNFIPPEAFPHTTFAGAAYDSGEYAKLLDAALARADWAGFEARRATSADNGRLRGIGLAYYVEVCSGFGSEETHVKFERDGRVTVLMGTQSTGQGHETSFGQIIADELNIDLDDIDIVQGDTEKIPTGDGTAGSRSMVIGGSAIVRTVGSIIDAGKRQAGEMLEAATEDIEFDAGEFRIVGTDRALSLREVALSSYEEPADSVTPGLSSSEAFTPRGGTFPNGCHICEIEVDPDTGSYDILRYTVEDDVGVVINPLLLEGQIVGGIAQGLGQACSEYAVYDEESGQLLSATFMDYTMPRADWIPEIDFHYTEVPSPRNPLGVKGAGEAGTIGAAPAFVSAVLDAVRPRGLNHVDMPVTPHALWEALHQAD